MKACDFILLLPTKPTLILLRSQSHEIPHLAAPLSLLSLCMPWIDRTYQICLNSLQVLHLSGRAAWQCIGPLPVHCIVKSSDAMVESTDKLLRRDLYRATDRAGNSSGGMVLRLLGGWREVLCRRNLGGRRYCTSSCGEGGGG